MLDGFKGDKYLGRGGCLASCQTVGIRLETSRVMTLRWEPGSGKEIYNCGVGCLWSGSGRVDYGVGEADLRPWTRASVKLLRWLGSGWCRRCGSTAVDGALAAPVGWTRVRRSGSEAMDLGIGKAALRGLRMV